MSILGGLGQAVGLGGAIGNIQNINPTQLQQIAAQQNAYNQMMNNQIAMAQQGLQQGPMHSPRVFDPNKEEAYIIPLSQLITLWQAKYNDQWVNENEFLFGDCDKFFGPAYERLKANMKFERMAGWVRLKEDA